MKQCYVAYKAMLLNRTLLLSGQNIASSNTIDIVLEIYLLNQSWSARFWRVNRCHFWCQCHLYTYFGECVA